MYTCLIENYALTIVSASFPQETGLIPLEFWVLGTQQPWSGPKNTSGGSCFLYALNM